MHAKRHTLANGMRTAAEYYRRLAADPDPSLAALAGQFTRQAAEASRMADDIEQAERIHLSD